jgi:hypothetical protein
MRRFLFSTAAGLLTLTLITPLQASPPSKGGGKGPSGSYHKTPYFKPNSPHNYSPHYQHFKFKGAKSLHYTHRYWSSHWNCYFFWCPTDCCWYYWYPACSCYYPIEYITVYPPVVEVAPVIIQTQPVVVTTPAVSVRSTVRSAAPVPGGPGTPVPGGPGAPGPLPNAP